MKQAGVSLVIGVRGLAKPLAKAANGTFLETPEQAGQWMLDNIKAGDAVLLKASRGVKLESALDVLIRRTNS
jgi:UDP-N-acetylmuramoyl-tripeptide--D-alanyl-D-alanine ligase